MSVSACSALFMFIFIFWFLHFSYGQIDRNSINVKMGLQHRCADGCPSGCSRRRRRTKGRARPEMTMVMRRIGTNMRNKRTNMKNIRTNMRKIMTNMRNIRTNMRMMIVDDIEESPSVPGHRCRTRCSASRGRSSCTGSHSRTGSWITQSRASFKATFIPKVPRYP